MPAPFAAPIDSSTRYCAVYGHPVRHSASPPMQNAALAALGLNWRYLAFDVPPENLRETIAGARAMGFVGLNLTVPHKLFAVEMVDVLDESARMWGAVNTIRFEGRDGSAWKPMWQFDGTPKEIRTHGFNTDADAILWSLREDLGFEPAGKRAIILGAGGAGRVAALRLAQAGIGELALINRTAEKAVAVAREIRERFPAVKVATDYPRGQVDLLLNATSLGLRESDPLPADTSRFKFSQVAAVYDMIYRPAETALLRSARAEGCRIVNGLGMLLHQGAKALELWTGQKAPITIMREALVKNVYGSAA